MSAEQLFSGQVVREGTSFICVYLSNQQEILLLCPSQFKEYNPWTETVGACFAAGVRWQSARWQWVSQDAALREKQLDCVDAIISTNGYHHHEKMAVICWMLSEMLVEPPRLSTAQRGDVFENIPLQGFAQESD